MAFAKSKKGKCQQGCREEGTSIHSCWECKLEQPLWRALCGFLGKPKIEPPNDPAVPLLAVDPKETISAHQRDPAPMLITVLFTIAKMWDQPWCS